MEIIFCNLLYLRVWELWVRKMVRSIIVQMYPTLCQIRVQVGRDNECTYTSLFYYIKYIYMNVYVEGKFKIFFFSFSEKYQDI